MAEIKGIDVSRWNGSIDWKTVASYGMGFAIIRITEKGILLIAHFSLIIKAVLKIKFLLEYINTAMLLLLLRLKMKQM